MKLTTNNLNPEEQNKVMNLANELDEKLSGWDVEVNVERKFANTAAKFIKVEITYEVILDGRQKIKRYYEQFRDPERFGELIKLFGDK